MLASPDSVTLKTISVLFEEYWLQEGVMLRFEGLLFGFRVLTILRKEPEKEAAKVAFAIGWANTLVQIQKIDSTKWDNEITRYQESNRRRLLHVDHLERRILPELYA